MTEVIDGCITEDRLFYHFDRFVFSKEAKEINYTSDDIYIFKKDISRVITLVANDIVSHTLNKMVDKGYMTMYWDKKVKDFIWLEKKL